MATAMPPHGGEALQGSYRSVRLEFISCYDINVSSDGDLSPDQYRDLAEFRRQIREFLHFSEATAKEHRIEPHQHQLLLAVHGLPEGVKPTIREIAARLFIQHHSAVELVNRLEVTGAIARSPEHRRQTRSLDSINRGGPRRPATAGFGAPDGTRTIRPPSWREQ